MNKKTENALKESILHWEEVKKSPLPSLDDIDGNNCALCGLFSHPKHCIATRCSGCPIFKFTGEADCDGTVYYDARSTLRKRDFAAFDKAASKMIEFLKSLLPKIVTPLKDLLNE